MSESEPDEVPPLSPSDNSDDGEDMDAKKDNQNVCEDIETNDSADGHVPSSPETDNKDGGKDTDTKDDTKKVKDKPFPSKLPENCMPPVIVRMMKSDRQAPYSSDNEYFEAILACETARLMAFNLKSTLATSLFAVNSRFFGNVKDTSRGMKLHNMLAGLTKKLDSIREQKLAVLEGAGDTDKCLPTMEVFLNAMQATADEKKVFRLVIAASSGSMTRQSLRSSTCSGDPLVDSLVMRGGGGNMGMTISRIHEIFPGMYSLDKLMSLAGPQSKWVKEKIYMRPKAPNAILSGMSNDVVLVLMGLEPSLSQYQAIESTVLQDVLKAHAWFQSTAAGKALVEQTSRDQLAASTRDATSASSAHPAPLVAALQGTPAGKQSKQRDTPRDRIFKALSSIAAVSSATEEGTTSPGQKSDDDVVLVEHSEAAKAKEEKVVTKTKAKEKKTATRETTTSSSSADTEFGPYNSELEYLEDQVRVMKMEIGRNRAKMAMDSVLDENDQDQNGSLGYDPHVPPSRLAQYYYGRGNGRVGDKDDFLNEQERAIEKLDTKLQKLEQKVATKLAATQAQKSHTPRLEQLCKALHLERVEKYVILGLVMSVIMPSSGTNSGGKVGNIIEMFSTSLEDKMRCRKYFYKSATLIQEGILTISQQDFMTDLTECKLSLDRRMFDFIVGLDTEFSELVDGSHLYNPTVSLEDVVLNEETKSRVCDCTMTFDTVKQEYDRLEIKDKITYGLGQVLLFYGTSGTGKTMLANAIAAKLKRKVLLVNFPTLGSNSSGALIKFLFREARINNALLFFDECESLFRTREHGMSSVNMILTELEHFDDLCILATNRPAELDEAMYRRITLAIEFKKPDHIMREKIWKQLHPPKLPLDDDVNFVELARKFTLTGGLIKNAWLQSLGLMVQRGGNKVMQKDLVQAASEQVIGTLTLEEFDMRVVPTRGIDSVVVSAPLKESLSNIVHFTKAQSVLFGQWGFEKLHRAQTGISALLCGPPGTGKSMAAEAIGFDLGRPLKVVNIAALVSKWVGETGKNIQAVFDDAKKKDAVLVFEEAEGLFGKRSSGDSVSASRHDTMNVGLLLQHIETFPGVCIVVTNLKQAIDEAFFRRFHFILDFERPTADLRKQLWESILPKECPLTDDVSLEDLARRYDLSGGNIKSALFRAATRAALRETEEDRVISMKDLDDACAEEVKKAEGDGAPVSMYV